MEEAPIRGTKSEYVATSEKLRQLRSLLAGMQSVLVAYSGGADSAFLLKVASDVLGSAVTAATATGKIYARRELEQAKLLAQELGVRHVVFPADQMTDAEFVANGKDRCYRCGTLVGGLLLREAAKVGAAVVVNGANQDDESDYRPGRRAASELGIRSPLREVRLGKRETAALSRGFGLPTWDKPSDSCLATRVPFGEKLTVERLSRIEACEEFMKELGFGQVRVRDHADTARIEVPSVDLPRVVEKEIAAVIVESFKALGYTFVSLDVEGYRTGSMNEVFWEKVSRGQRED